MLLPAYGGKRRPGTATMICQTEQSSCQDFIPFRQTRHHLFQITAARKSQLQLQQQAAQSPTLPDVMSHGGTEFVAPI